MRELREEVTKAGEVTAVTLLGQLWENTGTHNVRPSFYLVDVRLPEDGVASMQGTEGLKTKLFTREELLKPGTAVDMHTASLILLALLNRVI